MKITEKSEANSRQKSKNNSRQKSKANSWQSKPKDGDRAKAKYEEKHSTEESCSQRVPAVQQGQSEVNTTIPKDRFRRRNRGVHRKSSRQLRSSDTESPKDRDGFSQLEANARRVAEQSNNFDAQSAQQLKTAETSRRSLPANKEDLKQSTVGIPMVMQRQVLVIQ